MFLECQEIRQFWLDFKVYMGQYFHINLSKEDIFLGVENKLLSTLVFEAKRFIYQSRHGSRRVQFKQFLQKVIHLKRIEEQIGRKNNKVEIWQKR